MMKLIDSSTKVAIFLTANNTVTAKLTIEQVINRGFKIALIFPSSDYHIIKNALDFDVEFITDESISDHHVEQLLSVVEATKKKWYYQQIIKIKYWLSSDSDVLIIDGDTVLKYEIIKLAASGALFSTKERVYKYNNFLRHNHVLPLECSVIANFGFFPNDPNLKSLVLELLNKFFVNYNRNIAIGTDFSEYQVMGSLRNIQNKIQQIISLKIFRRADLLISSNITEQKIRNKTSEMMNYYGAICFESNHLTSKTKRFLAKMMYFVKSSW